MTSLSNNPAGYKSNRKILLAMYANCKFTWIFINRRCFIWLHWCYITGHLIYFFYHYKDRFTLDCLGQGHFACGSVWVVIDKVYNTVQHCQGHCKFRQNTKLKQTFLAGRISLLSTSSVACIRWRTDHKQLEGYQQIDKAIEEARSFLATSQFTAGLHPLVQSTFSWLGLWLKHENTTASFFRESQAVFLS